MEMVGTSEHHIDFFETPRKPLPGHILFDGLQPPREIVLAVNPRTSLEEVVGVLKAAKDTEQIVILELALSECDAKGGYSGLTPSTFAARVRRAADIVGWYGYVLHADHVTIGRHTHRRTEEEISDVKRELEARMDAGFTSFAIDASYLFDRSAETVEGQLRDIAEVSVEMFKHIEDKIGGGPFGKEGEVGEIGVTEFTTVEEALFYLGELRKKSIELDCLAINNGSKHGVTLDAEGKVIPQLTINLKRTVEIVEATRRNDYRTGIAQHGISGTPFSLIASKFPKGMINKGNVATNIMLLHWDTLQIYEPELYQKIYEWVIDKYGKEGVSEKDTFVKNSKYAIKEFFDEIGDVSEETKKVIRARVYVETLTMMKAFGMNKTAKRVYDYIVKNDIEY